MLLSTCFLFFIIWFCCFISYKDRGKDGNKKSEVTSLNKPIQEMQLNLKNIGIELKDEKTQNKSKEIHDIKVTDDKRNNEKNKKEYSKTCNLNETRKVQELKNVEDYMYLNEDEFHNKAFLNEENELKSNNYSIIIKNQPRLNRDEIEKEFHAYSTEYRKKFGDLLSEQSLTTNTGRSSVETIEYVQTTSTNIPHKKIGTYSHNFQIKRKKNHAAKIAFKQNSNKINNTESSIHIFKVKPRRSKSENIWQI